MSSFGALAIDARTMPFDALVAASGKCVEGPPGMGFVFVRRARARAVRRATRRRWRSTCTTSGRTWRRRRSGATRRRRTSSSRFDAALDQFVAEGGQPARLARYARNCETLVDGHGASWASGRSSSRAIQAPIIVTFHAPADPHYTFKEFYERVRDKGFILYPGKLTQVETFRVGCIGAIGPDEMRHAVNAVRDTLAEMGIRQVAPAPARAAA